MGKHLVGSTEPHAEPVAGLRDLLIHLQQALAVSALLRLLERRLCAALRHST